MSLLKCLGNTNEPYRIFRTVWNWGRKFWHYFCEKFVESICNLSLIKRFNAVYNHTFWNIIINLALPITHPWKNKNKNKKGKIREKRKSFKAKTIKTLSPRSKYYCFSHFRAFAVQKFFLSANHGGRQHFSVFHFSVKSILPALHILVNVCKKYSR